MQTTENLLRISLSAAVPLWIMQLRLQPLDGLLARAPELAQIVAEKGDIIQFRSKKTGQSAAAFNALAEGLAIMSFAPGGVTFLGEHYENVHPDTEKINGCCVDKACTSETCMRLPSGQTCGRCAHVERCTRLFGKRSVDVDCDFFPRRFVLPLPSDGDDK